MGARIEAQAVTHPLDALSAKEITATVAVLKASGKVDKESRFAAIMLKEPAKATVWKWQPGQPLAGRQAFVAVKKGPKAFEAIVDLTARKVTDWKEIEGVQPVVVEEEYEMAKKLFKADPRLKAALAKRGIKDLKKEVECGGVAPGYFGPEVTGDRRLLAMQCTLNTEDKNEYAHPISGIKATVDLNERKIISFEDTGVVPIPHKITGFGNQKIILKQVGKLDKAPKPLKITQPKGASYRLRGQLVDWMNWQFHFRMDPRVGLVVSTVTYNDRGKVRRVMYEGSLGEVFVPYGDPSLDTFDRTYLDAGEFYLGRLTAPLQKDLDCPANATYFDAIFAKHKGTIERRVQAVCLYEQRAGVEWRHSEFSDKPKERWTESRARRELVLRSTSTIGNYDYTFDWIFLPDGAIRVVVSANGTEETKAVKSKTLADDIEGKDTSHGTLVAEHISATTHQHIYAYRLDLDIDGDNNSFLEATPTAVPVSNSPRKSAMVIEQKTFSNELEARRPFALLPLWHVVNPNVHNANGYEVSYVLQRGENTTPLLTPEDWPRKRAGFIDYALWVTPYQPNEVYPAGDYPNQSKGGDGLPAWVQADRPIKNTDIVLWYTFGITHVVRPEDWPTLTTEKASFELRPFNFFNRTPTLGQPKYP
ncbi:copper amine oxidase [Anthocerotibacter panamensis]|uniref:copper amine oxidase n=1 Tax=Anthocerotibacter panamensis TaxID=2857077 RepID=UPI001C404056|nr:hypothetical protein [Anthocerotibacter panamensis]